MFAKNIRKASFRTRGIGPVFGILLLLMVLLCLTPKRAYATEHPTPNGFDDHDYQKLITFLYLPADGEMKNYHQLNWETGESFRPDDPANWEGVIWNSLTEKVKSIDWSSLRLVGDLDLSGCNQLEELRCYSNKNLTSLDVSGCTALKELYCYANQLTSLNVTGCNMKELKCNSNQLTSLDLSGCQLLERIDCSSNQLTSLDASGCLPLKELYCQENQLTSLNVSGRIYLEILDCDLNELTILNLSDCAALQYLSCSSNQLTSLVVSGCTALQNLYCDSNKLTSLDVIDSLDLQKLNCRSNDLTTLDVSGFTTLQELRCSYNQLTGLDLSSSTALRYLYCSSNQISSLDVSENTALWVLDCSSNELTGLDLSSSTALRNLDCSSNELTSLEVSSCPALEELNCSSNRLTALEVGGLTALEELNCSSNLLASLEVSGCTALRELNCRSNQLTFTSLPILSGVNKSYHPQNSLPIGVGGRIIVGEEINLSAQARVGEVDTIYTWYNEKWEKVMPATASDGVFTFGQDLAGEQIICCLTNTTFPGLTLETSRVLVVSKVNIINHPQDTTVAVGSDATFSIEAEAADAGEGGMLSYQWQFSTDQGGVWDDITGATENSHTTTAVTFEQNGYQYRCQVTHSKDGVSSVLVYSNPATLYVVGEPSITSHPQDTTVAVRATATFSIEAEAADAGEGGMLSYQWQNSTDQGSTWIDISDATGSSYTTPSVTIDNNGYQYRCQVTYNRDGVNSAPVASDPATLYVVAEPSIIGYPRDATVVVGATATFTIDAEAADAEEGGMLKYQWQLSTDKVTWHDIPDATENSYTTPEVTADYNDYCYRCQVINSKNGVNSEPVYNPFVVLSVVAAPLINSHPQDTTIAVGATATFTIVVQSNGVLSYQWQLSTDQGNTWNDIADATVSSYTIPAVSLVDNGHQYRCKVTNTKHEVSSEPVYSVPASLTVEASETHQIIFIKPTTANDQYNPVNISSGSLVLATITGDMNAVASVTIQIDDGLEQTITPSGNTIYHLLPANLTNDEHMITIKLTNTGEQVTEAAVSFYWNNYRRGFGFGRFDFGEAPTEE